ncbi:unnamed protein product [Closterium sp. NIES-53]
MVDRVLGEMNGAGIVTPEGGAALRSAHLSKKIAEPAGLLSGHGASIELSLARGESNGRRTHGAPTDKAAAKGEAIALRGAAVRLRVSPGGVAEAREERRRGAAKGEDMVLGPAKIAEDPLSGLTVLSGVAAGANEARKHADGVGKVGTSAHHGIHQRPNKLGIRVRGGGGRGGWGELVTESPSLRETLGAVACLVDWLLTRQLLHPKDPFALDEVGVGWEGDIDKGVIANECLTLQEDRRYPFFCVSASDGLLEGGGSEDGGSGGGAKDGKAEEVKVEGGKERCVSPNGSGCACEGGGKGRSGKLRVAAAAVAAPAVAAAAAAAPTAAAAAAAAAPAALGAAATTAAAAALAVEGESERRRERGEGLQLNALEMRVWKGRRCRQRRKVGAERRPVEGGVREGGGVGGRYQSKPGGGREGEESQEEEWSSELAGSTGAIRRRDEDERLAAPNAKASSASLGLRPKFCGGGGGMLRVGAEIKEEGSMEEGIAPEGRRGGGMSKKATSNLGDLTNATLSDAVLLRGMGEGVGLLNAAGFAVSGEGMIEELTPTIRVKAADGAFEVCAALLSPGNDHSRHLILRVKEEDSRVPTVVVDEDEHVSVPLARADGIRAP